MTALASAPAATPVPVNPYVGPRPFERGQRLYGRDAEVARLTDLLIAERIVLLYAPSGAGKTSLIRASLVARLEREGFRVLPEIRVGADVGGAAPANRYLTSTLSSLERRLPPARRRGAGELAGMGMSLAAYLDQLADGQGDGDVLIFDQFEELLVADPVDQDAKRAFVTELCAALHERSRWALFSMREDFVAGLDPYRRLLPTRLRTTFRLDLLGEAAARLAIQSPAREAGVDFTDDAAAKLVDSLRRVRVRRSGVSTDALGPAVEPVQLQVVCERLWDRPRRDGARITASDIEDVGDVDSALERFYAEKVRAVAAQVGTDERAIRTWFDQVLITEQGLRGQAPAGPLDGQADDDEVLSLLQDTYLVRAETRGTARWFELAHDRLVEPVRADNAAWRERNLEPFQRQAPLWNGAYQPAELLLKGAALAAADSWAQAHPARLTPVEREFLAASHRARRTRRARLLAIVLVALMLLTVVLTAAYSTRQSRSGALAAQAMALLAVDPADALEKALDATRWPSVPEARTALASALANSHVRAVLDAKAGLVSSLDVSRDGDVVVTVHADHTARLWNAKTGEQLRTFGAAGVQTARLSPDASRVVTAGANGAVTVWDVSGGHGPLGLEGHRGMVSSAQWSPDGTRIVTAGADKTARVWDAASGREQLLLSHGGAVSSARWSPDGTRIVTASRDETVRIWDAGTGGELMKAPLERVEAAAFSPDGTMIVAWGGGSVSLWDPASGRPPTLLAAGSQPEFSPDGRWILTIDEQNVRVWDVSTGQTAPALRGHADLVTVARFSPDGRRIVSASKDGAVLLSEVETGKKLAELAGHDGAVTAAAFSVDQADPLRLVLVTGSDDGTARVWEPEVGQPLGGDPAGVTLASFDAGGTVVVGAGTDGAVRVWRADTGQQLAELSTGLAQQLRGVAFSRDGAYVAAGGADGIVRVWDWRGGSAPVVTSPPIGAAISAVGFDPTGTSIVIAGADGNAFVWNSSTLQLRRLEGHARTVNDAAFSPDGQLVVTAGQDGTVRIWSPATGEERRRLQLEGAVFNADISPDGQLVVTTAADGAAWIWSLGTDREPRRLAGEGRRWRDAAFSRDGNYVVTGADDGTVGLWEVTTGSRLALLQMPSAPIASVQFSPDNRFILTASDDHRARIYACEVCAPLSELRTLAQQRLSALHMPEGP